VIRDLNSEVHLDIQETAILCWWRMSYLLEKTWRMALKFQNDSCFFKLRLFDIKKTDVSYCLTVSTLERNSRLIQA